MATTEQTVKNPATDEVTTDYITILRSVPTDDGMGNTSQARMTKAIYRNPDGSQAVRDFDSVSAFEYQMRTEPLPNGLSDLMGVIAGLDQYEHVVNGEPVPGINLSRARRMHVDGKARAEGREPAPTLRTVAHNWHFKDIDGEPIPTDAGGQPLFDPVVDPMTAARWFRDNKLPEMFKGVEMGVELSSSAGLSTKPGLNMRLVFWLSEPRTCWEMKEYLKPWIKSTAVDKQNDPQRVLDGAIYTPSQPIFCAPPVIEPGAEDPVAGRRFLIVPPAIPDPMWKKVSVPKITAEERTVIHERAEKFPYAAVDAPENVVFDEGDTIKWAVDKIEEAKRLSPPIVGNQLNRRTHLLAATLKDGPAWGKSLSYLMVETLIQARWSDEARVSEAAANGYFNTLDPPGSGPLGSAARLHHAAIERLLDAEKAHKQEHGAPPEYCDPITGEPTADWKKAYGRFQATRPTDAMRRPRPTYYDKNQLFNKVSGGSISTIFALWSNLKTTFSINYALQIAKEQNLRVLYVLGEGAGGFGPKTLAAAVRDWNDHREDQIEPEWLDEHLRIVENMPQLVKPLDVKALIAQHKAWGPNLAFFDTLGTALAGEDLNTGQTGTKAGDVMDTIARELACDTFYVHHKNKTGDTPTGTQYFMNNSNSALNLDYDQDAGLLTVTMDKDRWGERGRKVVFGVRKVVGLPVYNEAGELVPDETDSFVAIYDLTPEELAAARKKQPTASEIGEEYYRNQRLTAQATFVARVGRAICDLTSNGRREVETAELPLAKIWPDRFALGGRPTTDETNARALQRTLTQLARPAAVTTHGKPRLWGQYEVGCLAQFIATAADGTRIAGKWRVTDIDREMYGRWEG